MKISQLIILLLCVVGLNAQNTNTTPPVSNVKDTAHKPNEWYKKIALRGYAQVRYNRLLETNPNLKNESGDKSWGDKGGFFIRRARMIFSGNPHERVYIYVQFDLASQVSSSLPNAHFTQIRDCYFDLNLDKKKEYRLRVGQSKVPYGFENMQSSQNRLAMDRTDGINSATPNERDLGVFGYWAPAKIHDRFAYLVSSGLKGSGDYGVIGLGVYNGQSANKVEVNNKQHIVAHFAYPFLLIKKQYVEIGAHAYTGTFTIDKNAKSKGGTDFLDQRVCGSFVVYPQPLGIQMEYNVGKGPEFNSADSSVQLKNLKGGYIQLMYLKKLKTQQFVPFLRYHFYDGGKKAETDARSYGVKDLEIGLEWLPFLNFELSADYTISQRRFEDYNKPVNSQKGSLLRLQAQFNF